MRKFKEIPEEVKEYLEYSENSPSGLVWKKSTGRKAKVGNPVGCLKPTGYWEIRFKGKEYLAHRVVFFLVNETCPSVLIVDHKDGNPSNNAEDNLRLASPSESSCNTRGWKNKPSGLPKGVHLDKRVEGLMVAHLMKDGKTYTNSSFDLQELVDWLETERSSLHEGFKNQGYPQV